MSVRAIEAKTFLNYDGLRQDIAGRTLEKVEKVAATIRRNGGRATACVIDTTGKKM